MRTKDKLPKEKKQFKKEDKLIVESDKAKVAGNKVKEIEEKNDEDKMQIEGRNPILEALKAGQTIDKILIAESARQVDDIKKLAAEAGVKYQFVDRKKIDELAETKSNQGVLAWIAGAEYIDYDKWKASIDIKDNPLVIVLSEMHDPYNVGSIIRTAEAVGAAAVIVGKHRNSGITSTVIKASAGATAHMPIIRVTNIAQTLKDLQDAGFWVAGTDAQAKQRYYKVDWQIPMALVIGGEDKGLGPAVLKKCDYIVGIPMSGKVNSLNASVAAAVVMYEIVRQRAIK